MSIKARAYKLVFGSPALCETANKALFGTDITVNESHGSELTVSTRYPTTALDVHNLLYRYGGGTGKVYLG